MKNELDDFLTETQCEEVYMSEGPDLDAESEDEEDECEDREPLHNGMSGSEYIFG